VSAKCQVCQAQSELFLCNHHIKELHQILSDFDWWLSRLMETAVGQARLGEPARRGHRAGLEKYADPKPVTDSQGFPDGTIGERRLEQDLHDDKLQIRLLAQGGVNAKASDLFDEVQNMLGGWARDVCERAGLYWIADPTFIGPLRANEMRFAPRTASAMAIWLRDRVSSLASAECAGESFKDVQRAVQDMERAVNRPPEPKTCGPCPTLGRHGEVDGKPVFTIDADSRAKCGTRLEAKATAKTVRCPVCRQDHDTEELIARTLNEQQFMLYTIPEMVDVVLPKLNEHIPQQTLQRWHASQLLKPAGYTTCRGKTIPQFTLFDVRKARHEMDVRKMQRMRKSG
jgi:hypothetical protein